MGYVLIQKIKTYQQKVTYKTTANFYNFLIGYVIFLTVLVWSWV